MDKDEILHQLDLIDSVPRRTEAVPLFAEHVEVWNNRIDVQIVDRKKNVVSML